MVTVRPILVRANFFFNDTATTEIYTLSLHDALPISVGVNVRLTRQLAPATTVAPFVQVVPAAMAKSPGFEPARGRPVILRPAAPQSGRATACAGLVVLRRLVSKAGLLGAKVTAGTIP